MRVTISKTDSPARVMVVCAALIGFVCLVPAMSHLLALPLYKLNPMLLALLGGMLLLKDRRTALLLAVLLPVFSMAVVGMPTPVRALCMVAELLTLTAFFQLFEGRMPAFVALLAAMIISKVVFYGMLALTVSPTVLVGTSLWLQLGMAVVYAGAFAWLWNKRS